MRQKSHVWNRLRQGWSSPLDPVSAGWVEPAGRKLTPREIAWLGCLAVIFALYSAVLFRAIAPGSMTTDTFFQLDQALGIEPFNDWHPVIMSVIWRWLINATGYVSSMAAVQIGVAWFGATLTSYYLLNATHRKSLSLLGVLVLVLPNSANMLGAVWKDTHMAIALYVAVVCILIFGQNVRGRWVFLGSAAVAMLYATVVRKNAIAGVLPLIALCVILVLISRHNFNLKRLFLAGIVSLVAFGSAVVGAGTVLNSQTGATSNSQFTQVMLDDLIFAVPQSAIEASEIPPDELKSKIADARRECESKGVIWDSYWKCYGRGADGEPFTEIAHPDEVSALWMEQVPRHLPRYFDYRSMTTAKFLFTSNLQFATPADDPERNLSAHAPNLNEALRTYVVDLGLNQAPWIYHGWFWLLLGIAGCVVTLSRIRPSLTAGAVFLSGVLYLAGFFPTAPASDYRYIYWTALSVLLGGLVLLAERGQDRIRRGAEEPAAAE